MQSLWKIGVAALLGLELLLAGCGDTYRPIVNPITTPSGDPQSFDAVVSMNQNPNATLPGSYSQINVSGDILQGVHSIGFDPVAMSFDASRVNIFFANQSSDSVTVGRLSSDATVSINLVANSQPAAVTGLSTGRIYVANRGATDAAQGIPACGSGSVGIIDSNNAILLTNVCLPSAPVFLLEVPAYQKLYVLTQDGILRTINTGNGALSNVALPMGSNPISATLNLDGSLLYVLNQGSASITEVDVATDTVKQAAISTTGSGPSSFTFDKRLNRLYVANTDSNNVTVFDASVEPIAILRVVPVGARPNRVAVPANGADAFVSNSDSNVITQIDSTGFQTTPIAIVPTGMDAATANATVKMTSVAASNDGSKVYGAFVDSTDVNNGVAVVKTATHSLVVTLPAPAQDVSICDPTIAGSTCTNLRQRPMGLRAR